MNVVILNMTNGGLSGGYRKYLQRLLPYLQENRYINNLTVFIPREANLFLPGKYDLRSWSASDRRRGYKQLKAQLRYLSPDVVFIPTARWLGCCNSVPVVIMIRNMEPLTVPFGGNTFNEGIKNLARAFIARRACRRADRVIAVSHYVQDFLVNKWKIAPEKVGLVYHGIDPLTSPLKMKVPQALNGRDIGQFIFTAGSIRPARGLEDVIKAMTHPMIRHMHLAVIIGGEPNPGTNGYQNRLQTLAGKLGVASQVIWAGHLDEHEMAWCFHHSAAFVMTSRVEACPNIALEAMNHGCLIVSTEQPPMPEFFRDIAWYYHPKDSDSLAQKIAVALSTPEREQKLRRKMAQLRAADFRWKDTAEKTVEQLRLAVESTKG